MPRKRDFFHTGLNVSRSDLEDIPYSMFGANPTGAQDYFVDGNAKLSEDGLHWDTPVTTLAEAIALSNISIALSSNRWWAKRNRIFVSADWLTEDLVIFPEKTDIIGLGSADGFKGAGLTGCHVPIGSKHGTRWFNMNFRPSSAADIITLASTCIAQEFHDCRFHAAGTGTAVSAINATASNFLKIFGCDFTGAFSAAVIDIGAGAIDELRIIHNMIMGGANNGIQVTGATTVTGSRLGLIAQNFIQVNNVTIDDGSDNTIVIIDNHLVTPGVFGATSHVIDLTHACGNKLVANDAFSWVPPEPV